jgi:hypothetical protein
MSTNMEGFTDEAPREHQQTDDQANLQIRQQITLGMDMEIFLRSDVGRFLCARASEEIQNLRCQMDEVNPDNPSAVRDLQQEISVRKIWKDWIQGAIQEGIVAQQMAIERNEI